MHGLAVALGYAGRLAYYELGAAGNGTFGIGFD